MSKLFFHQVSDAAMLRKLKAKLAKAQAEWDDQSEHKSDYQIGKIDGKRELLQELISELEIDG